VNGGKEVVNAVADGKAAARAIDRDLGQPRA
jgi:NADPH-dependent glutamate synthase beta subunit-like oxidoreductase